MPQWPACRPRITTPRRKASPTTRLGPFARSTRTTRSTGSTMATSSLALAAAARYRLQRNPQLAVHRQTIGIEGRSDGGPTLQGPSARRRQGGLPFTSTMVCEPPDNGGSSSQAGETDDMPQAQVQSLVNTLNGEQPTYVLTFSSGFASGSC